MILHFGKHKGQDIGEPDIPTSYLKWLEEQDGISRDLRMALQFEILRRDGDRPGAGKLVRPGEARRPGKVRFD